ncbi:MAG: DUF3100 domain-containing protein [Methanobacteriaceae archaeon]|nr:DUF3100 domain-containing protein [Methanobacteriaceae archaeon]
MCIGIIEIPITSTVSILLLPLIYALIIGLALFLIPQVKFVGKKQSKVAEGIMVLFIGVLIAKLAVSSGQAIDVIIKMGPVLIIKQIGCLGSLFALPVGLILGFKREVIGMSTSICREPDLGIIIDRYGFKSAETRGVLTVFIIGSIIGTVFISFLSSICASIIPLHPYAYAMACGIGSASMNVAAVTPLMHLFPSMASDLEAFAGCSNLITFCVGIYLVMFVAIPLAEKMYVWLEPIFDNGKYVEEDDEESIKEEPVKEEKSGKILNLDFSEGSPLSLGKLERWSVLLLIFSAIVAIGNWVGFQHSIINAFIGMICLSIIVIIGMALERIITWNIPSILYISVLGIVLAIPGVPTADALSFFVSQIDLSVICTAFLAYVGIAIGNDWSKFKKMGWRGIIVTLFVIGGTFLLSAVIAQGTLIATGMI